MQTIEGHAKWVNAVAVSPDGRFLYSGGDDKTVKQWELEAAACDVRHSMHRVQRFREARCVWRTAPSSLSCRKTDITGLQADPTTVRLLQQYGAATEGHLAADPDRVL